MLYSNVTGRTTGLIMLVLGWKLIVRLFRRPNTCVCDTVYAKK